MLPPSRLQLQDDAMRAHLRGAKLRTGDLAFKNTRFQKVVAAASIEV